MKRFVLIMMLCAAMTEGRAQTNTPFKAKNFPGRQSEFVKARKEYRKADRLFERDPSFIEDAVPHYLSAHAFNPNEARLNYQIAFSYMYLKKRDLALPYFEKAILLDPKYKVHGLYAVAENEHLNMNWDAAIAGYEAYITEVQIQRGKTKRKKVLRDIDEDLRLANLAVQQCRNGKQLEGQKSRMLVINPGTPLNSAFPDFSPAVSDSGKTLFFTSRRRDAAGTDKAFGDVFAHEDIYISKQSSNGVWGNPEKLPGKVNTRKHEAVVWVSADGKKMLLYKHKRYGNLYESVNKSGSWSKPKPINGVNSGQIETHASMTADGKTLYFVRAQRNGTGDIFRTERSANGKKWMKPVKLGNTINTEWEENGVYISPDGKKLYFSSLGHTSIGGYDLFSSESTGSDWSTPVNMGIPVNSAANDIYIFFNGDKQAYFDSDRSGGSGEKDLYVMSDLERIDVPLIVKVYDSVTKMPVANASVNVKTATASEDQPQVAIAEDGSYKGVLRNYTTYELTVTAPDYLTHTETVATNVTDETNLVIERNVYLTPTAMYVMRGSAFDQATGTKIPVTITVEGTDKKTVSGNGDYELALIAGKEYRVAVTSLGYETHYETITLTEEMTDKNFYLKKSVGDIALRNILFDFDKAGLRKESIDELEKLKTYMGNNQSASIQISAHTDSIGSAAYNMNLSERRARSVVDWLTKNGISGKRLKSKGFGLSKPVATNETEEGRQLNRRVEFTVIE